MRRSGIEDRATTSRSDRHRRETGGHNASRTSSRSRRALTRNWRALGRRSTLSRRSTLGRRRAFKRRRALGRKRGGFRSQASGRNQTTGLSWGNCLMTSLVAGDNRGQGKSASQSHRLADDSRSTCDRCPRDFRKLAMVIAIICIETGKLTYSDR